MFIKTPKFWFQKNIISCALLPLSFLYSIGFTAAKILQKKQQLPLKKICVGNLNAGGSGKTPVALALGEILNELSTKFAYLTRGYGRKDKNLAFLPRNSSSHSKSYKNSKQFGDEALLLCEVSNTFISSNRSFGIRKIANSSAKIVIMDDGFQDQSLQNDLNILVIDGKIGFGNQFLLPAGPLRQSIKSGFKRADLIIAIGEVTQKLDSTIKRNLKNSQAKLIKAILLPTNLDNFKNKKLFAFCGIANPEKFFTFLKNHHHNIDGEKSFYDHKIYSLLDLKNLLYLASKENATLITTKKDWVKFPKSWQNKISYLDVKIEFLDKQLVTNELKKLTNGK